MPDFALCSDDKCPSKRTCRRHEASGTKPNEYRQTYGAFPRPAEAEKCEHYMPKDTK